MLIFFCENWHEASFLHKNTQKNKFEIWVLKTTTLDPRKSAFWVFEEKQQTFFSSCFGFDSALKTKDAQMFFWSLFLKTHYKKAISHQKRHFGRFRQSLTFFVHFKKYWPSNICASTVFEARTEKKKKKIVDSQKSTFMSFETTTFKYFFIFLFIV